MTAAGHYMGEQEKELGSAAFYLGKGAKIDSVKIEGNVAGRDVNIGALQREAEGVSERRELIELLRKLQDQVAALEDAPKGLQQDAADELGKAQTAGEAGDDDRLVEKLNSAQGYIERIATALPAAIGIAQTVATLVQRIPGMSGA